MQISSYKLQIMNNYVQLKNNYAYTMIISYLN
jgi:hypothetical protein